MKKSIFSRAKLAGLLVLFVCTWTFFAGCKNAPEDAQSGSDTIQQQTPSDGETQNPETNPSQENNLLKALLGTWMSQYNDGYTITKTTITYDDGGYGYGWEAELADVTESYIYVKKADEEYVAISYKDLTSASCSMAPDSRKSLNTGRLSSLFSTFLDNCDKAITGTFNSKAMVFNFLDISDISCCLAP